MAEQGRPSDAWRIEQPPVEDMLSPVRCAHCGSIYNLGNVLVTARYADCSVWTSPCCGYPSIDDQPWVRDRHYRELTRAEVLHAKEGMYHFDGYDIFGLRHRR